jgi:hypothetical protein
LAWWNVAAVLSIFAVFAWWLCPSDSVVETQGSTSKALAMLDKVVMARWTTKNVRSQPGTPMVPGGYHLESGMVQVIAITKSQPHLRL